jgi:hypothetical protein
MARELVFYLLKTFFHKIAITYESCECDPSIDVRVQNVSHTAHICAVVRQCARARDALTTPLPQTRRRKFDSRMDGRQCGRRVHDGEHVPLK